MQKRAIQRRLADFFGEPLRQVGQEHRDFMESEAARRADWQVIVVLVAAAFTLTVQYYAFVAADKGRILEQTFGVAPPNEAGLARPESVAERQDWKLLCLSYWALGQTLVYVAGPLVVVKIAFRRRLDDYGLKRRAVFSCWPVYVLMFLAILPCVILVSIRPTFQETYPFYRLARGESFWPRLLIWELLYAIQFFGLEFFFRGFVLHGTRRRFGAYSIFVMTVPYCMIHFGKPMLETTAAIAAGIILGFMSLKTRSIWMGAALHVAVAWAMDAAAIWRRVAEG